MFLRIFLLASLMFVSVSADQTCTSDGQQGLQCKWTKECFAPCPQSCVSSVPEGNCTSPAECSACNEYLKCDTQDNTDEIYWDSSAGQCFFT